MARSAARPEVLAQTLGFHIARAAVVAYAAFEEHIGKPHDLRKVDFSLLMLLLERGAMAPKTLVRELALTPPKLSMVLDPLEGRGLIRRAPDEVDRRSVRVSLSASGRRLAVALVPVALRMEEGLRQRLSPQDHAMLLALLRQLAG